MIGEKVLEIIEKDDVIISDVIPYLKANSHTYYNLDSKEKEYFKFNYNRLKERGNKKIGLISKIKIRDIINDENLILDYLYKIKIIDTLLCE
jgi:hypothetical protein